MWTALRHWPKPQISKRPNLISGLLRRPYPWCRPSLTEHEVIGSVLMTPILKVSKIDSTKGFSLRFSSVRIRVSQEYSRIGRTSAHKTRIKFLLRKCQQRHTPPTSEFIALFPARNFHHPAHYSIRTSADKFKMEKQYVFGIPFIT